MSYSYVKTVFPNFEFSNVYNDKLYTNVTKEIKPLSVSGVDNNLNNARIETYKQIESYQEPYQEPYQESYQENYKSNLTFYNKPIVDQDIPNYDSPLESFENKPTPKSSTSHDEYINHINSCPSCKEALLKQLGIETERLKNDEIMELISYILFGIFILILLDSLKK
jgi:hypothetical protein